MMMMWRPMLQGLVRWTRSLRLRRRGWVIGGMEIADARRLADAERSAGAVIDGCAWLDERSIEDLDLPLVFRAVDRTSTPTGSQALWRWLVSPAVRLDVLARRERSLAVLAAQPALRARIREALAGRTAADARHLPRLLWEALPAPVAVAPFAALLVATMALGVLAMWWPSLALGCMALLVGNAWVDDWMSHRLAAHGHALQVLGSVLGSAERVVDERLWRDEAMASELAAFAAFRKRLAWLMVSDPFGIADFLRAALLLRLLLVGRWLRYVERERERLRRVVLWLGELDALVSIASLRAERGDARLPELSARGRRIVARCLVHPAIARATGNDVELDDGLIVTGSNMSGKSTFLRTLAVNAICAQSIHTTFGVWQASLFRVFSVMRVADAMAAGMSTYAAEVDAIGTLVGAVSRRGEDAAALFVLDEPFRGTNPALRVPIVVAVLEYLGRGDMVVAATHDLDVAEEVDARFARGYFCEPDDEAGRFDYTLRSGIAPTSNALALLALAGYPAEIVADAERRAGIATGAASAPFARGR